MHSVILDIGWLACALTIIVAWPQIIKIGLTGSDKGVSALAWALAAYGHSLWAIFSYATGQTPMLVANLCTAAAEAILASWLLLRRRQVIYLSGFFASFAVVLYTSTYFIDNIALEVSLLAAALGAFWRVPQWYLSRQAATTKSSDTIAGVSTITWLLLVLSSACWVIYGVAQYQWVQSVVSFGNMGVSLIVLLTTVKARVLVVESVSE